MPLSKKYLYMLIYMNILIKIHTIYIARKCTSCYTCETSYETYQNYEKHLIRRECDEGIVKIFQCKGSINEKIGTLLRCPSCGQKFELAKLNSFFHHCIKNCELYQKSGMEKIF